MTVVGIGARGKLYAGMTVVGIGVRGDVPVSEHGTCLSRE